VCEKLTKTTHFLLFHPQLLITTVLNFILLPHEAVCGNFYRRTFIHYFINAGIHCETRKTQVIMIITQNSLEASDFSSVKLLIQ